MVLGILSTLFAVGMVCLVGYIAFTILDPDMQGEAYTPVVPTLSSSNREFWTAEPSVTEIVPTATPVRPANYPYIYNVLPAIIEIYEQGRLMGNRAGVFSKVGDSITVNPAFLNPIGWGVYDLREYSYLQPVVDYYSEKTARDSNSFANTSLAARGGWSAWSVLNFYIADEELCLEWETPLVCEYRTVRPSVALILLGTNDVVETPIDTYEGYMREVIETSIEMGVIPVVSTIPEFGREGYSTRVASVNAVIVELTYEYGIPLWDYHAAMAKLPNNGLSEDGIHPSWLVDNNADFTPENLQYGLVLRNLMALQVLDAVLQMVAR